MILAAILLVLLSAGLAAWIVGGRAARWIALGALAIDLALALSLSVARAIPTDGRIRPDVWTGPLVRPWLPLLGARLHLACDGVSAVLLVLTMTLGLLAVAAGWREIDRRIGLFHFALLWCLAGVAGVFVAADLLLFYFFWELMLVPMYLMIGIWGSGGRARAALQFALFTQAGGMALFVATITLAALHARQTGVWSFDYHALAATRLSPSLAAWLMAGFLAAFLVKLPAVPLHTWLAPAHTEAPTAGSVVLAGLLLKTGGYGILRFAIPLFPDASRAFAPWGLGLGAVGALYGAWLALAQRDLKRLVAYTSVSHMGFVLLGAYSLSARGVAGAVLQMICHGLSTGGMFVCVGALYERTGTRDLLALGGLWRDVPRLGAASLVLAMASLGLPGLGNFVAELLVLLAAWRASPALAAPASGALILATVYALRFIQLPFQGPRAFLGPLRDLDARERCALGAVIVLLVALGLAPMSVVRAAGLGGGP